MLSTFDRLILQGDHSDPTPTIAAIAYCSGNSAMARFPDKFPRRSPPLFIPASPSPTLGGTWQDNKFPTSHSGRIKKCKGGACEACQKHTSEASGAILRTISMPASRQEGHDHVQHHYDHVMIATIADLVDCPQLLSNPKTCHRITEVHGAASRIIIGSRCTSNWFAEQRAGRIHDSVDETFRRRQQVKAAHSAPRIRVTA